MPISIFGFAPLVLRASADILTFGESMMRRGRKTHGRRDRSLNSRSRRRKSSR